MYKIKPWDHQLKGIDAAKEMDEFAFFFEVGTGKTCAAINTYRHWCIKYEKLMNAIVFCPPVVIHQWKKEFAAHSNVAKYVVPLIGTGTKRLKLITESHGKPVIFITNYETLLMKPVFAALSKYGLEVGIFDESHKLKNPTAKRTKLAATLSKQLVKKLILTGTPILNSPLDLFSQFLVLDNGKTFGDNFYIFRGKYFFDKNAGMPRDKYFPDWRPRPGSFEQLNEKIFNKSMRAKKEDCLDLPPLTKQEIHVEMSPDQKKAYKEMERDFITYLEDGAAIATMALTKLLRLQQIVSGFVSITDPEEQIKSSNKAEGLNMFKNVPRIKALKDILEELTPEHKIIVWACFRYNYVQIREVISGLNIKHVEITGDQSAKQKQENIKAFREDDSIGVCLANQRAGGVGVNLTEASYSIYFSRTYSLEDDVQSEARNYRGGSERHSKITRIDLVSPGTVDSEILAALKKKINIAEKILEMKPSGWQ